MFKRINFQRIIRQFNIELHHNIGLLKERRWDSLKVSLSVSWQIFLLLYGRKINRILTLFYKVVLFVCLTPVVIWVFIDNVEWLLSAVMSFPGGDVINTGNSLELTSVFNPFEAHISTIQNILMIPMMQYLGGSNVLWLYISILLLILQSFILYRGFKLQSSSWFISVLFFIFSIGLLSCSVLNVNRIYLMYGGWPLAFLFFTLGMLFYSYTHKNPRIRWILLTALFLFLTGESFGLSGFAWLILLFLEWGTKRRTKHLVFYGILSIFHGIWIGMRSVRLFLPGGYAAVTTTLMQKWVFLLSFFGVAPEFYVNIYYFIFCTIVLLSILFILYKVLRPLSWKKLFAPQQKGLGEIFFIGLLLYSLLLIAMLTYARTGTYGKMVGSAYYYISFMSVISMMALFYFYFKQSQTFMRSLLLNGSIIVVGLFFALALSQQKRYDTWLTKQALMSDVSMKVTLFLNIQGSLLGHGNTLIQNEHNILALKSTHITLLGGNVMGWSRLLNLETLKESEYNQWSFNMHYKFTKKKPKKYIGISYTSLFYSKPCSTSSISILTYEYFGKIINVQYLRHGYVGMWLKGKINNDYGNTIKALYVVNNRSGKFVGIGQWFFTYAMIHRHIWNIPFLSKHKKYTWEAVIKIPNTMSSYTVYALFSNREFCSLGQWKWNPKDIKEIQQRTPS